MKCQHCFNEIDDSSKCCAVCGAVVSKIDGQEPFNTESNQDFKPDPFQTNNAHSNQNTGRESNPYQSSMPGQGQPFFGQADFNKYTQDNKQRKASIATLVTGPLAVFFVLLNYLTIPFVHLIGLALGIVSITVGLAHRKLKYSYTTAGIILGVIAVIGAVASIVIGIIYVSVSGS